MVTIQERVDRIERTGNYQLSERDAFLEAWCEVLGEQGVSNSAQELAAAQDRYNLKECKQFIEENS